MTSDPGLSEPAGPGGGQGRVVPDVAVPAGGVPDLMAELWPALGETALREPASAEGTSAYVAHVDRLDGAHLILPPVERTSLVRAAGAVCWRLRGEQLEVLVVHRPQYDDWSWPKGKLEADEPEAVAAVREVAEETGLGIVLGRQLPTARYRLSDVSSKTVRYWAAHVPGDVLGPAPLPDEVDRCEWVSVDEAEHRLTRRGDRAQLHALVAAHTGSELMTWPFLVLRHGHARPKSAWGREDAERPLVGAGRQQAMFLAPLLSAWDPRKVFSSPWRRCLQSVEPYVEISAAKLRTKGRLSEDGHRRDRAKTASLVAKHLRKGQAVLVCTHRPVLGTVLGVLAGHAAVGRSRDLPLQDPFLEPGEVLVAHVSMHSGRVVAVERHTSSTA